MDRDNRWERVKKAYDLMVKGEGESSNDIISINQKDRMMQVVTDEFVLPIVKPGEDGRPVAVIKERRCSYLLSTSVQTGAARYRWRLRRKNFRSTI
jgi:bisphosphoglycerate-independent phosphoglycerate mutase (AlkP superfamily)